MVEVLVEFDYDAEQEDELTIRVGQVIKNVIMSEGGWWEGELNGKKGMFPDNFVKVKERVEKKKEDPKKELLVQQQRSSVKELANRLKDVHVGSAPQKKKDPPHPVHSEKKKKAKVMFDYEPENDDELKIEVGDIVEIIKQEEEGWWEGILNGKTGVFPSNFVELLDSDVTENIENQPPPVEEKPKDPEIKGKKIMGVGLGNIFEGGPIKLRTTGGGSSKKTSESNSVLPTIKKEQRSSLHQDELPQQKPSVVDHQISNQQKSSVGDQKVSSEPVVKREKPASVEKAIVRYSYSADNEDELTLKENDIITILDKDLEDAGWWKGELNGNVGVFPDNFVELIPAEELGNEKFNRQMVHSKILPQRLSITNNTKPKPKKPPPPSSAASQKIKLPEKDKSIDQNIKHEKATVAEPIHTEKHVKKKEPEPEKPQHPHLPGKKPVLPPPVGKKPTKPDPPRPLSDGKPHVVVKEEPKDASHKEEKHASHDQESHFDAIEPTTDKLVHLTANRAKGPTKRPPSQVIFNHEEDRNGDVREGHWIKEEKPFKHPIPSVKEQKEEPIHKDKGHPEKSQTVPARPPEPSIASGNLLASIEELKKDLKDLKANCVSKAAYDELKAENEKLKQDFEHFKTSLNRRMRDLMNEVDDEKKIRLSTEVEIKRIKKLVNDESHV